MGTTVPGLAENLRAAREVAGMSQYQAAEKSGVHQVSIARYETGTVTPSLAVLYKLAAAYGFDVRDLLPGPKKPRKRS